MSRRKKASKKGKNWIIGKTEAIENKYKLGSQVGQPGQFGRAYLCERKEDNKKFAVKKISKRKFGDRTRKNEHFKQLKGEIEIMQQMKHDNIIEYGETFESQEELWIVMERCTGGELFDRIKAQPSGSYSEKDASAILRQICSGIEYMHKSRIAHCDLKPDNFLFLDERMQAPVKIIDFGMSKIMKRGKALHTFRGTPYYVAPEVILGDYTEHCDMWSFGVIMFVMLFGYPPFHAETDDDIFKKIKQGFEAKTKAGFGAWFPQDIPCSDPAKDLMKNLMLLDKQKRYSASEAMVHPWLTGKEASEKPMLDAVLNNMKEFVGKQKLKIALLNTMVNTLTDYELENLKKTFESIDKDKNGTLSVKELQEALETVGKDDDEKRKTLENIINLGDIDGDGEINYKEMQMSFVHMKLRAKEDRLYAKFMEIDENADGMLSKEEISKVFENEDDDIDIDAIIAEIDTDGDGFISYEEFLEMWQGKVEPAQEKSKDKKKKGKKKKSQDDEKKK